MTERYGSGYGDEGGQRPSGRGAVTERLARQDHGAHEIDLTDEATARDPADDPAATAGRDPGDDPAGTTAPAEGDQDDRAASGAFEPAPTADPPAADRPGSSSIFDVDERAKQEDLHRTGYEPATADDPDPAGPRGETHVTEPGEPRQDDTAGPAITPTPVPVAEPPSGTTAAEDQPAPPAAPPAADTGAALGAPGTGGTAGSLLGSLDAADLRNRFLDIQAGFVDEPRQAVEEAGRFVDDLLQQVADALQQQRGQLAGTTATAEGSTEDLRLALRAYRQFVDRLLGLAG